MIDPRSYLRASVEGHLTSQLEKRGIDAHASYTKVALKDLEGTLDETRKALSGFEADAVLISRLTDRTDIKEPEAFQSNEADWKQAWAMESLQSTEFQADTWGGEVKVNIHMQSKLYRLSDGALLWVGYAQTKLGETTDDVQRIQSVSKKIVSQLKKDGLIQ